jgi:ubiquinone/menaquinone biosynthesis C-methylase UbiE
LSDFKQIYSSRAEDYERLVEREDYRGKIKQALVRVQPLSGLDVVELGAGTGRLTCLLAPEVKHIEAFDISDHMLAVAKNKLFQGGFANWHLGVADNRQLPLKTATADLALAGWSLAHSVAWYPESWHHEIGQALAEMARVVRPGGTIILLETLGTNREEPLPPTPELATYYHWLEQAHRFRRNWIRTDYAFDSVQEAAELTRFFFGDEMADDVLAKGSSIVPECTGIWWRTTDRQQQ